MPWDTYPHRPGKASCFGGGHIFRSGRMVVARNVITIDKPMVDGPSITLPTKGIAVAHARDVWQRMYFLENDDRRVQERTVQMNGALYSAPSPGGGAPPNDASVWTEITLTVIGQFSGNVVKHEFQEPSRFALVDYIDLWSWVYQPPERWSRAFTVVHELWVNQFYWKRTLVGTEDRKAIETRKVHHKVHLHVRDPG